MAVVRARSAATRLFGRWHHNTDWQMRERSVLLQSPSMVSCRRKAISLSVRQRKRYEHTLKHIYIYTLLFLHSRINTYYRSHKRYLLSAHTLSLQHNYITVPYPSADLLHCKHHCWNLATAHSSAGYVDLS